MVNRCCLCKNDLEDRDHLFLNCNYSQNVWNKILSFWNIAWVHHNKIEHCFQSRRCLKKDSNVEFLWNITLPHLWWGVWKQRNNKIFREKEMPDWVLVQNIIEVIKENLKAQKNGPNDILIDNPIQNISIKNKVEARRSNFKWKGPPEGWIKGNIDGAAKGNPRKVGCGGIIRDH